MIARIKVAPGTAPCAAAAAGGAVWVSEYGAPYLLRIDPKTNRVLSKTQIGFGSCGLGAGAGSLWVEDTSSSTVSRVSVRTRKRIAITVDAQPYDATFAEGAAWATAHTGGYLDRIDPPKNRIVKRFRLPSATGVVGAFGSIWATGSDGVIRVDPATNQVVRTVKVGAGPFVVTEIGGEAWVPSWKGADVWRLKP